MNAKKTVRWLLGGAVLLTVLYVVLFRGLPVLFYQDLPFIAFFQRCFYVLLLAGALCMVRVLMGPTAADRIVAIDILGILIVGFCAILCIPTGRNWYIDIGIAWALQSFIATIALAKFLEGRGLDE
jgi:multicomponent Na+:H+ antiporter subunit F